MEIAVKETYAHMLKDESLVQMLLPPALRRSATMTRVTWCWAPM